MRAGGLALTDWPQHEARTYFITSGTAASTTAHISAVYSQSKISWSSRDRGGKKQTCEERLFVFIYFSACRRVDLYINGFGRGCKFAGALNELITLDGENAEGSEGFPMAALVMAGHKYKPNTFECVQSNYESVSIELCQLSAVPPSELTARFEPRNSFVPLIRTDVAAQIRQ